MKIVVTQPIHRDVEAQLSEHAQVVIAPGNFFATARDADGLMVFMPDSVDDAFLSRCERLKVIGAALKGFDNFDVAACTRRGIWFTIVPDLLSEPTAELAMALMLGLARHVREGDSLVRSGNFRGWRPILYGASLRGATVGIVGFGAVGKALARMLTGFDCKILHYDLVPSDAGVELSELVRESDFVLPLLPLTSATLHLFNTDLIAAMKPGAFLINVSRGSLVNEVAVADSLEAGKLAGYAADTFEMEDWARPGRPPEILPRLLRLTDQTLFTPHLGSAVASVRLEIERTAALNILQALRGETPANAINRVET